MTNQTARISWRDTPEGRVPVSDRFDDPYFSLAGGLAETRHVFLDGNAIPDRLDQDLHIAELGFGTGLNLLATWAVWAQSAPRGALHFTSFEATPMALADLQSAHRAFPTLAPLAQTLRQKLVLTGDPISLAAGLTLSLVVGDVRDTLPAWSGHADAWYLDGFSPAKNPQMWGADVLNAVYTKTAAGGTLATYTAAGDVRRGLAKAGFTVSRTPGFGRKRHMTQAHKP